MHTKFLLGNFMKRGYLGECRIGDRMELGEIGYDNDLL
jgi:hypothetical protein